MSMPFTNLQNNIVANFMASLALSKMKKKNKTNPSNKQLSPQWRNLNKVL